MSDARKIIAELKGVRPQDINNQTVLDTNKFEIISRPTNDKPVWKLKQIS